MIPKHSSLNDCLMYTTIILRDIYGRDVLTLDACLAVGGWFSSDGSDLLGSGLLVEVLVPKVHIVDVL